MRVLLIGYGEMGKQVETVLLRRNHEVIARIDPVGGDLAEISREHAAGSDIAIEFAVPESAFQNMKNYCAMGLNAVVGTTGWYDRLEDFKSLVEESRIGYLYGSNFSIGAHIFFRIVGDAVSLINGFPDYDILGYELHHKRKKDSPSGTARKIAEIILDRSTRKKKLAIDRLDRAIHGNELHFASVRGGEQPGLHRVVFDSEADTIELTHRVRNRKGLALGAVMAAEWMHGRQGFLRVEDFIEQIIG